MSFQIAALAGATALSMAGSLAGGYAQGRAHRQTAGQYAVAQQESKVQTMQEEVARRRQYMDLVGTNTLDIAGRGVTSDSGSYTAIQDANLEQFEKDVSNARYLGDTRTRRLGLAAHMSNRAASTAITGGWISAGTTLLGNVWRGYQGMSGNTDNAGSGLSSPSSLHDDAYSDRAIGTRSYGDWSYGRR